MTRSATAGVPAVVEPVTRATTGGRLRSWLLRDITTHASNRPATRPWWRVMCLTGLNYFSTLGYQPGIALLAAGLVSPLATVLLVGLTLFGVLPVYRGAVRESPGGPGPIAMLARLLPRWTGKVFILVLLGFAATDFVLTITLSTADATVHILANPYAQGLVHGQRVLVTLALIALLAVMFLRGFRAAMGIAVALVGI